VAEEGGPQLLGLPGLHGEMLSEKNEKSKKKIRGRNKVISVAGKC
jgi:hypothetical protein